MEDDNKREKWNLRYEGVSQAPVAIEVLTENAHLLPSGGDALDLACGLGGSALFLAQRGLATRAWDLSAVAIEALRGQANGLPVVAETRDVTVRPPEAGRFDVICVGHFLDRALCPKIVAALKPGGLLYYQTFSRDSVDDSGPANPLYRLDTNELLKLFPGLIVRFYRDEGREGDVSLGFRNRAQLVAQRPG
jgi:SAM-dependent methyltransferase